MLEKRVMPQDQRQEFQIRRRFLSYSGLQIRRVFLFLKCLILYQILCLTPCQNHLYEMILTSGEPQDLVQKKHKQCQLTLILLIWNSEIDKSLTVSKYVTSSAKTRPMEEQKDQGLIRCRAFYAASDKSWDFLSFMSTCIILFSLSAQLKNKQKHTEIADLGKYCLLLHKPGFPR